MADYTLLPCDTSGLPAHIRIATIVTCRHMSIVDELCQINTQYLRDAGLHHIDRYEVPGCLEMPGMIAQLAGQYDIIIAFGLILKGQTMHYEFISQAIFNGIVSLSIQYPNLSLISGILTVEDKDLVQARISDNFARSAINVWKTKQGITE
jgi:6,7-dimethyl-8-ribityllumazine synthase